MCSKVSVPFGFCLTQQLETEFSNVFSVWQYPSEHVFISVFHVYPEIHLEIEYFQNCGMNPQTWQLSLLLLFSHYQVFL